MSIGRERRKILGTKLETHFRKDGRETEGIENKGIGLTVIDGCCVQLQVDG
jgi:hypothetical protein